MLLVVGLVVLAIAPSAAAAKPDNYSWDYSSVFEIGSCDGFEIVEDTVIAVKVRVYYDKDGNVVRLRWQHHLEGRVYNSTDPSKWLPEIGHFTSTDYPDEGIGVQVGLSGLVKMPGQGHVALDAGRFTYDMNTYELLWQAGPHQIFNGEPGQLCEALSSRSRRNRTANHPPISGWVA